MSGVEVAVDSTRGTPSGAEPFGCGGRGTDMVSLRWRWSVWFAECRRTRRVRSFVGCSQSLKNERQRGGGQARPERLFRSQGQAVATKEPLQPREIHQLHRRRVQE